MGEVLLPIQWVVTTLPSILLGTHCTKSDQPMRHQSIANGKGLADALGGHGSKNLIVHASAGDCSGHGSIGTTGEAVRPFMAELSCIGR